MNGENRKHIYLCWWEGSPCLPLRDGFWFLLNHMRLRLVFSHGEKRTRVSLVLCSLLRQNRPRRSVSALPFACRVPLVKSPPVSVTNYHDIKKKLNHAVKNRLQFNLLILLIKERRMSQGAVVSWTPFKHLLILLLYKVSGLQAPSSLDFMYPSRSQVNHIVSFAFYLFSWLLFNDKVILVFHF